MVLGVILGTILGSKWHPKIDEKINQILDRFWKDFGSQFASFSGQFWLQKSIKNQGRFLIDFWMPDGASPGSRAGLREGLKINKTQIYIDQSVLHAQQCCGGLSTLRGTPPQHLFDVDLLWNDPARFEFCF